MSKQTCINLTRLARSDHESLVARKLPISLALSFVVRAALRHLAGLDAESLGLAVREQVDRERPSPGSDVGKAEPQSVTLHPFGDGFMVKVMDDHPCASKSLLVRTAIAELCKLSDTDLLAAFKAQSRPEADLRFPTVADGSIQLSGKCGGARV